jgi:hypothetical protein
LPGDAELPEQDPKWYFTVHSAWCPWKKSGNLTVELLRPEITDLKWEAITYDEQGNESGKEEVTEIEYGTTALLCAKTSGLEDGEYMNFTITNEATGFSETKSIQVKNNEVELRYDIPVNREKLALLTEGEDLEYACAVETANKRAKRNGGQIKVGFTHIVEYAADKDAIENSVSYVLKSTDGEYNQALDASSDAIQGDRYITLKFTQIIPGKRYTLIKRINNKEIVEWEDKPFMELY